LDWKEKVQYFDDSQLIVCPVCGHEYNHPMKVNIEKKDKWLEHPDKIAIQFECERGCTWTLIVSFHGGHSTIKVDC
jgi:hypothetical protein